MISTHNQTLHVSDVAIVGAGPGGLAAAIILAASGASVHVYEAQPIVGGRSRRLTLDGAPGQFHFDVGPTFFMMPYVLDEILASAGSKLSERVELQRLDPHVSIAAWSTWSRANHPGHHARFTFNGATLKRHRAA